MTAAGSSTEPGAGDVEGEGSATSGCPDGDDAAGDDAAGDDAAGDDAAGDDAAGDDAAPPVAGAGELDGG